MKNHTFEKVLDAAIVLTILVATATTVRASGRPLGTVPDAASTAGLMTVACAGLAMVRSKLRK